MDDNGNELQDRGHMYIATRDIHILAIYIYMYIALRSNFDMKYLELGLHILTVWRVGLFYQMRKYEVPTPIIHHETRPRKFWICDIHIYVYRICIAM